MSLDLPPPLPPQQADPAVLEQRELVAAYRHNVIELKVQGYRLLVSGNTYLSEKRIRKVTSAAKTPSEAILLLNALYSSDGYLLVNVQYARKADSNTIYVQVNQGYLADVDAPPKMEPFFDSFEDQHGLTAPDVEPERVLAELKSNRAGYNMSTRYTVNPADPNKFTLVIDGKKDPDHRLVDFSTAFGNPGNRFLGRYFGVGTAKLHLPNGDEIGAGYAHGFTDLGDSRGGGSYNRYDLNYSLVSSYGLYSVSGAFTKYRIRNLFADNGSTVLLNNPVNNGGNNTSGGLGGLITSIPILGPILGSLLGIGNGAGPSTLAVRDDREKAKIYQGNLNGSQFLYANDKSRWILKENLEYVKSTIDATQALLVVTDANGNQASAQTGGFGIQDEEYGAARLGTTFSSSWRLFDRNGSVSFGLGYKRGLAGKIDNNFTDNRRTENFNLTEGNFTVKYSLPFGTIGSIDLKGQYSINDRLPQQEQFVLGGADNLAAYLPGILVGDSGGYGRFQIDGPRWTLFGRPYRFSLFTEAGFARFEGPNPPISGTPSITDVGLKFEAMPFKALKITAHVAQGLSHNDLDNDFVKRNEANVFFNVKATF